MVKGKGLVEIAAPADRVWNWIIEPEKYLVWNLDFQQYEIVEEKEEKVGTRYYMAGIKGGRPAKIDCIITEWEENKKLAFSGTSEGFNVEGVYNIQPTEEGCKVTFEENLEFKGIVNKTIGALFVKRAKAKNIEESLQNLKKIAEED